MKKTFDLMWVPPLILAQTGDGTFQPVGDHYSYQLPLSQVWPLLDLNDCIADLDSVIAIGRAFTEKEDADDFNFALFNAMVIIYGRGFGSGKSRAPGKSRRNLSAFVELLPAQLKEKHDSVLDIRNRQVAHTVDTGSAGLEATFARDGSFLDLGGYIVGLPGRMSDVQMVATLAEEFRDLAVSELDRMRGELKQVLSKVTLTRDSMDAADRALHVYLDHSNNRPRTP